MKKQPAALTMAAASLTLMMTTGCATGPQRKPGDPFEPANRAIFKFNDTLDRAIAQPIAKGYQKVTPQPLRQAITNFFSNLGDVSNFANDLLQLKITAATEDLMRLTMNSTFGLGGLIDFATPAGLPKHHQDFGLTLGHYGIPAGPYLVLPVFGPSSVRDGIGMGVDVKFNLLNYIDPAVRNPMYVAQFISARSDMLGATDLLSQAALDKYSFVRDAYRQQRESMIRGSTGATTPLPDYGDPGDTSNTGNTGDSGAAAGAGAAAAAGTAAAPGAAASAAAGASATAVSAAASAPVAASAPAAALPASAASSTPAATAPTTPASAPAAASAAAPASAAAAPASNSKSTVPAPASAP